ncbi:peroxisome membrane protein [Gongronella butleri]|nr:peroxisome membrane protein [Gongronella butleri]
MLPTSLLHFKSGHTNTHKGYATTIDPIEDLLRALSILLPGRVAEGDVCAQTVLTALNLVSLYNTHYLIRTADKTQDAPDSFAFNRYLRRRFQLSKPFQWASLSLSVISYTEVLLEMLLTRSQRSKQSRWRLVACVESIKLVLRLLLYYGARRRMVLHPTHFLRNVDAHSLAYDHDGEDRFELGHLDARLGLPSTANDTLSKPAFPTPRFGLAHVAELLWMARPLVYVLLLAKAHRATPSKLRRTDGDNDDDDDMDEKDEENHWQPWLVSLGMDVVASLLRQAQPMTPLEHEEAHRRNYLFLFYLLRGPVYSLWARPFLDWLADTTEHRPLISILTTAINDYRPFWEQCYFYTSGS